MIYSLGALFILCFPFSDVASASLALAIGVLIVLGSVTRHRMPELNLKDALFLAYAAFALVPLTRDPSQAPYYIAIVAYPWLITFVFQNITYDEGRVQLYLYSLILVTIVLGAYMVFQVQPGQFDFSISHLVSLDRSQGFFFRDEDRVGPNTVAYISSAAIVFVLAHLRFARHRTSFLYYGVLVLPTLFLVVSGGRNAWVGTASCFLLFLYYRAGQRRQVLVRTLQAALIVVAIGGTALATSAAISSLQADAFSDRLYGLLSPGSDASTQVRLLYWANAIALTISEPWGVGFNEYFSRYDRSPHNELLGQMLGAGWIGALAYSAIVVLLWRRTLRMDHSWRVSNQVRFACLCLLVVATLAMVTENISRSTINSFSTPFWVLMGMAFGAQRQARMSSGSDSVPAKAPPPLQRLKTPG